MARVLLDDIKNGQFLKYKYSPDNIIIQVKKIIEKNSNNVTAICVWLEGNIEQEFVFNKDNVLSWEKTK